MLQRSIERRKQELYQDPDGMKGRTFVSFVRHLPLPVHSGNPLHRKASMVLSLLSLRNKYLKLYINTVYNKQYIILYIYIYPDKMTKLAGPYGLTVLLSASPTDKTVTA